MPGHLSMFANVKTMMSPRTYFIPCSYRPLIKNKSHEGIEIYTNSFLCCILPPAVDTACDVIPILRIFGNKNKIKLEKKSLASPELGFVDADIRLTP